MSSYMHVEDLEDVVYLVHNDDRYLGMKIAVGCAMGCLRILALLTTTSDCLRSYDGAS